jgi:peptidoglycan/LPS O-acetylase OafA/YrhL
MWYRHVFYDEISRFPKWAYFLFLQNIYVAKMTFSMSHWLGPTWSLAVEEQFYLLLPFTIWLIRPKSIIPVSVVLIGLVPILRTYLFLFHSSIFGYVLLPCRADTFLLGVLCAGLMRHEGFRSALERNRAWLRFTFCVFALGMALLTIFAARSGNGLLTSFEMTTIGFTWIAVFYATLILLAVTSGTGLSSRILRLWPLRHSGIIAYGLFMMNMTINTLAQGLILGRDLPGLSTLPEVLVTLLAFLITWFLAALSWRFLERPIVRWGHSFNYMPPRNTGSAQTAGTAVALTPQKEKSPVQ